MKMPLIKSVMTSFPYWIEADATLAQAEQLMREKSIQHLPVKEDGKLVGVLTSHDMQAYLRERQPDVPERVSVDEVCVKRVYVVDLEEPLDNVLLHMARYHIGSALVTKQGRLAGLFTLNDACRSFGEFLRRHYRTPEGDDAA